MSKLCEAPGRQSQGPSPFFVPLSFPQRRESGVGTLLLRHKVRPGPVPPVCGGGGGGGRRRPVLLPPSPGLLGEREREREAWEGRKEGGNMGPAVPLALRLMTALLLLLLLLPPGSGAQEPPRRKVPQPTNVTIESFNFNTSVRWDYKGLHPEPLFVLELRCYGFSGGVYMEFSSCVNISQHYCDLTHKVEHCEYFWVRVKALDGLQESEYTESQRFNIYRNGQIGPPKLNLYVLGHEIHVDIEHPLTPYRKKQLLNVKANFTDFMYKVSFWKKGNREKHKECQTEICNRKNCTINLNIDLWGISYCVSAHGISEDYSIKGEESKESCIDVPSKPQSDLTVPLILGILGLFVLMVIHTIIFICMKKKNIKLPKSLAAVVRNQVNNINTNSEPRNFSFITSSSDKQVLSECDDEKSLEQVDLMIEVNTTDVSNCGTEVDPYGSQGALSKAGEESISEGMIVENPEGEQNSDDNDNYFKSVGVPEEMDNNFSNVDLAKADLQPSMCCQNISGYDKPHWKDSVSEVDSLVT